MGAAPVIDGTIAEGEWADSAVVHMDDGTEVRLRANDGYLYVGIMAAEIGAANLLIFEPGAVRVLHSSAALGSALYQPEEEAWRLVDDFSWCCRSVGDQSGLDNLLEKEGWLASNGFAGVEGHVEYQVLVDDEPLLAISYVLADGTASIWPLDLNETARQQLFGVRRPVEEFGLDQWTELKLPTNG